MAFSLNDVLATIDKTTAGAKTLADKAQMVARDPVGSALESAYFWTSLSPKVGLTAQEIKDLMAGKRPPAPPPPSTIAQAIKTNYLKLLKPTLEIRSPLIGNYSYAPHGRAGPEEWKRTFTIAGAFLGVTLLGTAIIVYSVGYARGSKGK